MHKALRHWCRICTLGGLLLLAACSSTTFVYNRLDFLLPWYVDDYVGLNEPQKQYLDGLLEPFLVWHRSQELPEYLKILNSVEDNLKRPQTPAMFAAVFNDFESAWLRLEGESLDWLLDLGEQLSDEQIAEFMQQMWQRQEDYQEEYLERSDEEFYEDSDETARDTAREYLGPLSDAQRELLLQFSHSLLRSDRAWLQARAHWLTELGVLLERKPGWQDRVREAVAAQRRNPSPEYARIYEHNLHAIYDVMAQILNTRSEQQDKHLYDRLSSLREDLQSLIADVKVPEEQADDVAEPADPTTPDPAD